MCRVVLRSGGVKSLSRFFNQTKVRLSRIVAGFVRVVQHVALVDWPGETLPSVAQ